MKKKLIANSFITIASDCLLNSKIKFVSPESDHIDVNVCSIVDWIGEIVLEITIRQDLFNPIMVL